MSDIFIRKDRRAGRITLTRPQALNSQNHAMVRQIDQALQAWRRDDTVELVIIDAEGERAFCAGGDVVSMCRAAMAGDHQASRDFFRDEYRMNARIAEYPKPVVSFMQGYVMGGGVGLGCHASLRIVGETTRMAMPEAGIGLIPDIGGTWLLAHAPGRVGEYLAVTGAQMGPGDAIFSGFADLFIPLKEWPALIDTLAQYGDVSALSGSAPPQPVLENLDLSAFGGRALPDIIASVEQRDPAGCLGALRRNSPLSMAAGLALVRAARSDEGIRKSLAREYRFTYRATERADFVEGVRALLIDKDKRPKWNAAANDEHVRQMLAPLGDADLLWEESPV